MATSSEAGVTASHTGFHPWAILFRASGADDWTIRARSSSQRFVDIDKPRRGAMVEPGVEPRGTVEIDIRILTPPMSPFDLLVQLDLLSGAISAVPGRELGWELSSHCAVRPANRRRRRKSPRAMASSSGGPLPVIGGLRSCSCGATRGPWRG